MSHPFIRRKYI